MTVEGDFARAVDRLINQVGHWSPGRWTGPAAAGDGTRAEVVHALAQRLADLAADATGDARRPVPRLGNDLSLPDQVRVMALDLLAAPTRPDLVRAALAAVTTARRQL